MQFIQSFTLVASFIIFMYIASYSFRHRKVPGAFAFFILIICAVIWSLGSFFELHTATLQGKIFWRNLEQIGVFGLPISTVYFAVVYTRHTRSIKYVIAAAMPQVLSVLLIFTNDLHHLMRVSCALEHSAEFGESLVVHSTTLGSILVSYNFALPLAAVLILFNYACKLAPGFRKQVYILISSFLFTFAVAWIKTALLEPLNIFVHISVLYTPAALAVFFSIFKHRTFNLSPVARDKIFDVINQGILVLDEHGTIIDGNTYALAALADYFRIQNPLDSKLGDLNAQYPQVNQLIGRTEEDQLELHIIKENEDAYITLSYYPLYHHKRKYIGSVMIINNVTVQKLFERKLKDKAEKDYLTRMLNKFGFQKALQHYLTENNRRKYSVLMIDIDNFKLINDTFGHAAGDAILRHFTDIVNGIIRSEDIAGRLGGDEFVIVVPNIYQETAFQIAERIRITVEDGTIDLNRQTVRYTISTGIADNSAATRSFDEILENADKALYRAKSNSRNCTVVYTEADEA